MSEARTLGSIVKSIRADRGWTLSEMSQASGIPLSTLSKIEHDKLTLTYDKLQQFSRALDIPLSELFAETRSRDAAITARRSVAKLDNAVTIKTPNYVYHYLCSDLRQRRMLPVQVEITAKTLADFGDLVSHGGEEFSTVLEGAVVFHSEFYSPIILHEGEGIYIDSNMGHAYLVAEGYERATIMSVCASDDENLQERLIAEAESRGAAFDRGRPSGQVRPADKKKAA